MCTANIARSPLLAALLQAHADDRLTAGTVAIGSAGTDARVGDPAATGSRRIAETLGLTLDEHRSLPVMAVPMSDVALVITMGRAHRAHVRRRHPDLSARTFTLRELVALLERADVDGAHAAAGPGSPRGHLERVVAALDAHRPLPWRQRRQLDVPDPIGGSQAAFDAMGAELTTAAARLADVLFGPAR